ncbi:hypothetical protein GE21DRAFT_1273545 [Neurospora crassa]|nr:hypothetical protein GE21DRAFT_1273545 [Neurospora crassa]
MAIVSEPAIKSEPFPETAAEPLSEGTVAQRSLNGLLFFPTPPLATYSLFRIPNPNSIYAPYSTDYPVLYPDLGLLSITLILNNRYVSSTISIVGLLIVADVECVPFARIIKLINFPDTTRRK